jgi:hypothetical protein
MATEPMPVGVEEMLMHALGIPPRARIAKAIQSGEAVGGDGWYDMFSRTPGPSMSPTPEQAEDARLRELISRMTAQQAPQAPVPEEEKTWQRVLAGIADAASTWASAHAAVPRTDLLGELRDRRAKRESVMSENERRRMEAEGESDRMRASVEYQQIMGEREARAKANEKEEERAFKASEDNIREDRIRERERLRDERKRLADIEIEELKQKGKAKTKDSEDKPDRVSIRREEARVIQLQEDILGDEEMVLSGKLEGEDPDRIWRRVESAIEDENLSPENEKKVKEFAIKHIYTHIKSPVVGKFEARK